MSQYACLDELQTWLDSYLNFEKLPQKNIFWLDTMAFLCERLGNPQNAAPVFHVAGSKGKGSVSAMIASILDAAGYRTGLYSSPHILDFAERIGRAHGVFSENVYRNAAKRLMEKVGSLRTEDLPGGRQITWFELVTLYGFLCFQEAKTDYNVLEVGLGGRLDATNVVTPLVSCITPIELEHTEFLGDTIAKIAAEKGGIIKNGVPAVIARQTDEAKAVFTQIAKERKTKAYFVDEVVEDITTEFLSADYADYADYSDRKNLRKSAKSADSFVVMKTSIRSPLFARPLTANLRLLGAFQAENAALAAIAVKIALPEIDERVVEKGLENTTLPGRFEIVSRSRDHFSAETMAKKRPFVILDGAHTVNSVSYTLNTFRAVFGEADAHLLFACAADKDMQDIAPLFAHGFSHITLTKPGAVKQSNLSALTAAFDAAGLRYTATEDFTAAIYDALEKAETAGVPLLVTGSFYLLAEVKKILLAQRAVLE